MNLDKLEANIDYQYIDVYHLRVLTESSINDISINIIDEYGFKPYFKGSFFNKMENDVKLFGVRLDEFCMFFNDRFGFYDSNFYLSGPINNGSNKGKIAIEKASNYITNEIKNNNKIIYKANWHGLYQKSEKLPSMMDMIAIIDEMVFTNDTDITTKDI